MPELFGRDEHGAEFKLTNLRGKLVLLFFGYASCPDVCPWTLSLLKAALDQVENAKDVRVVFVTVDPERDSEEIMNKYVNEFGFPDQFIGVRPTSLEAVTKDFRLMVERVALTGTVAGGYYAINHTSTILLIDRRGNLATRFWPGADPKSIASALRVRL